ncbi:glycosyltransferase family 2 protein [Sphingomonas daechungensis]
MAAASRVSVISSFFNAEDFLAECVQSVLEQDFADLELILVDDGSEDRSSQIALSFAASDERVRYLEHPGHQNRGTCASRNLGLRESSSELVAFIDADDRWRPLKLRQQLEIMDQMPDVDAVCGAVNFWASHAGGNDETIATGHVFNRAIAAPEGLLNIYPLGKADPPCPSDLLMRRTIVEAIGGFEESFTGPLQLYEDQAFLAKFFLEGTLFCSDQVWLDYRVHDRSCTSEVVRSGLQPEVRRHCLEWFENYLASSIHRDDPRVRSALLQSLRPYRHPFSSAVANGLQRVASAIRPTSLRRKRAA